MTRALLVAVLALAGGACGAARGDLPVQNVPGALASSAPVTTGGIGRVVAIVALDGDQIVFAAGGVAIMTAGVVTASEPARTGWIAAARVAAPDGDGSWVLGVDARGVIWRVRRPLALENTSARFGLAGRSVRSVAAWDTRGIVFALDRGIAVADGHTVVTFDAPAVTALAGGAGRIAGIFDGSVRTFVPATNHWETFAVRGATSVVIGDDGALWIATPHALYREIERGRLTLAFTTPANIHALFSVDHAVAFRAGDAVMHADARGVSVRSIASASTHGRVVWPDATPWLLEAGAIARLDPAPVAASSADVWSAAVEPVFRRSCVPCHLPGGSADVDLSNVAAWSSRQSLIATRVVRERSMPPTGHALSDSDRSSIAHWVSAPAMP